MQKMRNAGMKGNIQSARRVPEELRELYTAVGTALPDPPEETTPPTPLPTANPSTIGESENIAIVGRLRER